MDSIPRLDVSTEEDFLPSPGEIDKGPAVHSKYTMQVSPSRL
jgi:hypothetical protein